MYHWVWESAIAPTYRAYLRNRLFKLRDEIRSCKCDVVSENDKRALVLLHESINIYLTRLHLINMSLRSKIEQEYENNPKLRERVRNRREILTRAENPKVLEIYAECNDILEKAYLMNAGGWFVYLVPVAILVAIFATIKNFMLSLLKFTEISKDLLAISPRDAEDILPAPTLVPA